jgi:hypothetical protein
VDNIVSIDSATSFWYNFFTSVIYLISTNTCPVWLCLSAYLSCISRRISPQLNF